MKHQQKIINYYNATHLDYKALWISRKNLAIHFGYYDEFTKKHRDALMRMNQVLAEFINITKEDHVLDAGCGYGGSAMWLAENMGCNVTGITIVPMQVNTGRLFVAKRKLQDKVRIEKRDFANTLFSDSSFTVYWALESIVHAENREKVLQEAIRLLKKGGRLVIAEYTYRQEPPLTFKECEYMKFWLNGWAMPTLLTPKEQMEKLKRAGFKNIKYRNITNHVAPSLKHLEMLSILNYPIAKSIGRLFFKPERLQNYYASKRQVSAFKRGLWEYSIFSAEK